jgi:hypothetical protein
MEINLLLTIMTTWSMTLQAAQQQINAILSGCTTASSIKEFTNPARQEYDKFFLPKNKNADQTLQATLSPVPTYAKNDDHGALLYTVDGIKPTRTRTPVQPVPAQIGQHSPPTVTP